MSTEERSGASSGPEWRRSRNGGPDGGPDPSQDPTESAGQSTEPSEVEHELPQVRGRRRGKRLVKKDDAVTPASLTSEQRLLILDAWQRSGLPAKDFAPLVGISHHTLYNWKRKFDTLGPAGLEDGQRGGPRGTRLPDVTKRAILLLKKSNPEWGCRRISDVLYRGKGYPASAKAVARVLKEAGYELEDVPTVPHRDKVRRFERGAPCELWQTDLFSFMLKRQNRRVHLVAFLDDHSRYIVSFGLSVSASTELVLEALRQGIAAYGAPKELLTDNGSQYVTWRGKSQFTKECEARGIRQIVARPRHPQTLGKTERFWGTLWRELLNVAVFVDLGDAQTRIGHFIDHYNFRRPHRGIDGSVPADRFFGAAPEVKATLDARVKANAAELARDGEPKKPFYLTGQVGDRAFSVHAEGERVYLVNEDGEKEEVELTAKTEGVPEESSSGGDLESLTPHGEVGPQHLDDELPPGASPLDAYCPLPGEPQGGRTAESADDRRDERGEKEEHDGDHE